MAERHLAPVNTAAESIMETVIVKGDLSKLSSEERAIYYAQVCRSMGLNPLTKPFDYLTLSGKTVLYASRTATDQLRKINGVSIEIIGRETVNGVYVVTARATDATGRTDTEIGAVTLDGLKGDAYANALMKATTKAKRRATLSICGLGWLDETEVETIPNARVGEPASEPTPIKTTVQISPKPAEPTRQPERASMTGWSEFWPWAKSKGVKNEEDFIALTGIGTKNITPDQARERMEAAMEEMNRAIAARENGEADDGEFVDVAMFETNSPDRFTR